MKGLSQFPSFSFSTGKAQWCPTQSHSVGRVGDVTWWGSQGQNPFWAPGKELWAGEGELKSSDLFPGFPLGQNPGGLT